MLKKQKSFRLLKKSLLILFSVIALKGLFLWWAIGTVLPRFSVLPIESAGLSVVPKVPSFIRVASYNIGHGQGVKLDPTDWRDEATTREHLKRLAAVLRKMNADVVLLQEVDIEAKRTHYINEAAFLQKEAGYAAYACALVWDKNYLPFPVWPIEYHIGPVKSANCVLSRFPIVSHERLVFEKPESNAFWYNWGYIDRAAQKVELKVGANHLTVVNVHTEAWDKETRQNQVKDLLQFVKPLAGPMLIGGDFNALPPHARQLTNFVDEVIDFTDDMTIELMQKGLGTYTESLPGDVFTFPANAPTRRLDYIFATKGARVFDGQVVKEAGTASDHLPIMAKLVF